MSLMCPWLIALKTHQVPVTGLVSLTLEASVSIEVDCDPEEYLIPDQAVVDPHPPDLDQDYSFLHDLIYDQHRQPKKNDTIFYFDRDLQDWPESGQGNLCMGKH